MIVRVLYEVKKILLALLFTPAIMGLSGPFGHELNGYELGLIVWLVVIT